MRDDDWYSGVAIALAAVVVVVFLTGLGLGGYFGPAPAPSAPRSTAPIYLYFTVTTSAATLYDTYYPANVSVPHGEPVYITITSYDPGVNNVSAPYNQVIGTTSGTANYSGGQNLTAGPFSHLSNGQISHTFTVSLPGLAGSVLVGAGQPVISVPVPVSPDGIRPASVVFQVTFPTAGEYTWTCLAPCDPYSMVTPGFMLGSINVT